MNRPAAVLLTEARGEVNPGSGKAESVRQESLSRQVGLGSGLPALGLRPNFDMFCLHSRNSSPILPEQDMKRSGNMAESWRRLAFGAKLVHGSSELGDVPMSRILRIVGLSVPALALSALPSLAQSVSSWWRPRPVTNVPEIDASSGVLAIAAVAAILAFVVERRRRT